MLTCPIAVSIPSSKSPSTVTTALRLQLQLEFPASTATRLMFCTPHTPCSAMADEYADDANSAEVTLAGMELLIAGQLLARLLLFEMSALATNWRLVSKENMVSITTDTRTAGPSVTEVPQCSAISCDDNGGCWGSSAGNGDDDGGSGSEQFHSATVVHNKCVAVTLDTNVVAFSLPLSWLVSLIRSSKSPTGITNSKSCVGGGVGGAVGVTSVVSSRLVGDTSASVGKVKTDGVESSSSMTVVRRTGADVASLLLLSVTSTTMVLSLPCGFEVWSCVVVTGTTVVWCGWSVTVGAAEDGADVAQLTEPPSLAQSVLNSKGSHK